MSHYEDSIRWLNQHPDATQFNGDAIQPCGISDCSNLATWKVKPWATWHSKPYCTAHASNILHAALFIKSGAKTYE